MKKILTKFLSLCFAALLVVLPIKSRGVTAVNTEEEQVQLKSSIRQKSMEKHGDFDVCSLADIGQPILKNGASYSDNVLYYPNSQAEVGYDMGDINALLHVKVAFEEPFTSPQRAGFTFRAGAMARTQEGPEEQKGYSFILFYNGAVEVYKNGNRLIDPLLFAPFNNRKLDVYMGAVVKDNKCHVILEIDDEVCVNIVDETNPIISGGNWFNISCSNEANVCMRVYNLNKVYAADYDAMTICDIFDAPVTSGLPDPIIDKDGYIQFSTPANTIAYKLYQTSFILSFDLYFDHLPYAANFWIAIRAKEFTRANYIKDCYVFRFSTFGHAEIYKSTEDGFDLVSGGYFYMAEQTWYTIDLCSVMSTNNTMMLGLGINGKNYASYEDSDPIAHNGMLVLTADGDVTPTLVNTTSSTYVFNNKIVNTADKQNVELYFMNSVCSVDKDYNHLSYRMLNAISLDNQSIYDINQKYYALDKDNNHIRAVDMRFVNNVLNLEINKVLYKESDDSEVAFNPSILEVSKTENSEGLESDSGYRLIFSYYLDLNN